MNNKDRFQKNPNYKNKKFPQTYISNLPLLSSVVFAFTLKVRLCLRFAHNKFALEIRQCLR